MNLFLILMLFSRRKARSHHFVGSPSVSKQWGYDSQNDSAGTIESYSITIPLSTSQVFSYATGSSGNDLTNIQSISGNTMLVRTFRSLQTDEGNWVKRPFHYIIVCK